MYFLSFLLLHHLLLLPYFTTSKSCLGKKRGFLSLMANSHKFVLNMSSIDWPCRMNTIKETALSASHLGGENERMKKRKNRGRGKTRGERIGVQKFFFGKWCSFSFGLVTACPHVAVNVCVWAVRLYVFVCVSSFLLDTLSSP